MPLLPDRMRARVLVVSLAVLGGAILLAAVTAWASSNDDSSAAQAVRRVGLMHVGTDHIPPALERAEGPPRGARMDGG